MYRVDPYVRYSVWIIYDPTLATEVPVLSVDAPDTLVFGSTTTSFALTGTIDDDNATVVIDVLDALDNTVTNASVTAAVHGTNWWAELPVLPGSNIVVVTAKNAGSMPVTQSITTIQDPNVFLQITSPLAGSDVNTNNVLVVGLVSANFDGGVLVNGHIASTSSGPDGISFSASVPIDNADANIIEVQASGSSGASATVRQIVYGYAIVNYRFHRRDHGQDETDNWFAHHYPDQYQYRWYEDYAEEWSATNPKISWTWTQRRYGFSGTVIDGWDYSGDFTWDWARGFPWDDLGLAANNNNFHGVNLDAGRFEGVFHDCPHGDYCQCQQPYCEGQDTSSCCIDTDNTASYNLNREGEFTFIKHWPTDEEQMVILHFDYFYYWIAKPWLFCCGDDPSQVRLWGQQGILLDADKGRIGFVVKIKTNTRYTIHNTDFTHPGFNGDFHYIEPNAQSRTHNHWTGNMHYFDNFANALLKLDIVSPVGRIVPQDKKATVGEVIAVNYDDDDNDSIARGSDGKISNVTGDKDDTDGVQNENDLVELRFYKLKDMDPARFKFRLEYADEGTDQHIVIWKAKTKNAQNSENVESDTTEFPVDQDNSVWVEGVKAHDNDTGEFVTLKLVDQNGGTVPDATDRVKIVVARPIILVFGDGPDQLNKLALLDYLTPRYKDHRPQPRIVKQSGQSTWYSVELFGTTGSAGEKLLEVALATDGAYVAFEGHSNYGIGPAFAQGHTRLSDFTNTMRPGGTPVNLTHMHTHQGHPNLAFAPGEIAAQAQDPDNVWHALQYTADGMPYHYILQTDEGDQYFLGLSPGNSDDVPPLRYKMFLLRGCGTDQYYSQVFSRDGFICTSEACPSLDADIKTFVSGVLLSQSETEILDALNAGGDPENPLYVIRP